MSRTMIVALALALAAAPAAAQDSQAVEQRSNSGPRVGLTYVTGPAGRRALADNGLEPLMSQFGWHFEQITRPIGGGPMFVIEEILLIGAVDQGTAVPSLSLLMGIRMPSGWEFGVGPNITPVGSALAIGIGKSLRYGAVTLPLNIAIVRSPGAVRWSFLFGYALESNRRAGAGAGRAL